MATKLYHVIYADPPWPYNARPVCTGKSFGRGVHAHYPVMSMEEMKELSPKVKEWADRNCLLAMWTTGPRMPHALELMDAWGFTYATVGYVWQKTYKNGKACVCPGYYTSSSTEFVLFGRRGHGLRPYLKMQPQVIETPFDEDDPLLVSTVRREHSRKPDEIRWALEASYPWCNWLELFARQPAPGWDAWGNEVDKYEPDSRPEGAVVI